jgi:carotenoid 1,2-hydratase
VNAIELPEGSGAYRWWYVDVQSGEYTAVFIFMVGSIFSARYSAALKKGGRPREHAAVNFALYQRGVRTLWVLTEYGDVERTPNGRALRIGASWLRYHPGGLTAEVRDRTTPFLLTSWGEPTQALLELEPVGPLGTEVRLVPGLEHHWRPIAARARATVRIPSHGLTFSGHAYHDGNHGTPALGTDLAGWDWARVHTPHATTITYRPWASGPATLVRVTDTEVSEEQRVLPAPETRRSSWGLPVPGGLLPGASQVLLESSPFYARAEAASGTSSALGEVADFARFHNRSVRWMAGFRTRLGEKA